MKKIFDNAEIEIVSFEMADIISTSGPGNNKPFAGEDDEI